MVLMMVGLPLLFLSCIEQKVDQQSIDRARVLELDSLLHDRTGNLPGFKVAEEAIVAFRAYGNNYPDDTLAAPYHLKAAHLAFTLGQYKLSADIFSEVVSLHPETTELPYIYTRLGSLFNDHLNDTARARTYFTMIIENFPGDPYVESAQFGLETLGMDQDEQFKIIQQRNAMLAEE